MVMEWKGEHFITKRTDDVPALLRKAADLGKKGTIKHRIWDIEGCYPNMPKHEIKSAIKWMVHEMEQQGHNGVWVPTRSTTAKCRSKSTVAHSCRVKSLKM